jgi:hypothetical protein
LTKGRGLVSLKGGEERERKTHEGKGAKLFTYLFRAGELND